MVWVMIGAAVLALLVMLGNGVWVDEGLEPMQQWMFGDGGSGFNANTLIQPFTNDITPANDTVYDDLEFDDVYALSQPAATGWGYNLDDTAHKDVAQKLWQWNFPSDGSADGNTYYGIAIYQVTAENYCFYVEKFADPFVVEVGNRTLQVNLAMTRQDCST